MSVSTFREMNKIHFGYRMVSGNAKPKPPSQKDLEIAAARRKLEDIKIARELGINVEDLQ